MAVPSSSSTAPRRRLSAISLHTSTDFLPHALQHPSSYTRDTTAVHTPMHHSEASTRLNSLDLSAAQRKLHKLHGQVEKGDTTAIAETLDHIRSKQEGIPNKDSQASDDVEKRQYEQDDTKSLPSVMLDDDEDPLNWSNRRKWIITALVSCLFMNATITSSVGAGATAQYIHQFGISQEAAALVLSIYMLGFGIAPPLWGPLSELQGRLTVNYISLPGYCCFNVGCALAPNLRTLLVCRFFAGVFAAAPQSNSGGTIADIWLPRVRTWPMFTYSLSAFMGPTLGLLVGGFIAGTDLDSQRWRWIYWMLCLLSAVSMTLVVLVQRETYAVVLLRRKADRLRQETGRNDFLAPGEALDRDGNVARQSWTQILKMYVARPFHMLFTETPLMYAAAWTGFCYAVMFIFFEAYPFVFGGIYGFNAGEVGLAFLAIGFGIAISAPIVGHFNKRSLAAREAAGGKPVPESRLPQATISAPLFVISFFWFGWTARKEIHYMVPILAGIPFGTSTMLAFNSLASYAAECYHIYTASALAAMAFSRCIFAVFVPLFGRQMFQGMGVGWASSLLGFVSLASIPVPFLFLKYGKPIRQRSKLCVK